MATVGRRHRTCNGSVSARVVGIDMETAASLARDLDAAFPKLVETYQDALYRFALRLTNNGHDAEDVAQEAFIRAYRWLWAQSAIEPELRLKPWLYQVTLNVFRNRARKRQPATAPVEAAAGVPANG